MKQGSNNKRPRRGGAPKGNRGPVRNQTFDSNGPGIRVRGNAQQVMEKYLALARDAVSSGDRILAENYYQHAEHYFRIANVNGALTQRVQQGGLNAPQTPASDHSALDDLFEYEEEAALQQVNGGHGGDQRDYQQPPQQQYRHGRDAGDEDDGEGADSAEADAGERHDNHGERQGRNRRQRGRRGGRDRADRHEGGDEQPSMLAQAAPEAQGQPQAQPQSQPAAAVEQPSAAAAAVAPAAP
ncbi:DUF4167 domain-containing protein, partial [Caenispirillum bisanense]|uniref:DUF4167 domain-containing protein n=1 Tax=Caenispirillum bisanense TaxID=414052 RepID=UPI0031DC718D